MYNQKSILAIIPARGGSKGIPGKNIKKVHGKPLIGWIIEAGKNASYIDRLILSSDDPQIIKVATALGCEVPFIRPSSLAQDHSSSNEVVFHALKKIPGYDYVMMLQPTSPLTSSGDIDGCIEFCISTGSSAVVSVTKPGKSPYWMFNIDEKAILSPMMGEKYLQMRRQNLPETVSPNGAIFMAKTDFFLKHKTFYYKSTRGFGMPFDRSIDIDTAYDLKIFEFLATPKN
jgi:N-acylneuraminate cytidylyltransferase